MSALAVVLRHNGVAAEPEAISALLHAQRARGPDGERYALHGPVVMGERLLHPKALPLAAWPRAQQPVATLDAYTLVWDGRIDNRSELVDLLRSAGESIPPQAQIDDRRLLLHLWRRWGADVLPRLLGDFALAIWDAAQQRLTLARDAMGARPLYYTVQPGYFALASEDEALLCLPGVSPAPNLERVAYALCPAFQDFDWSSSWLAQVRILMPGTALRVDADGTTEHWTWWRWTVPEPARYASDEEALEAFDAVFTQAVADRTRDLDTLGLITSGGIDTATIAVAAARVRAARPLRLFATVQDDPAQCIESRAIEALAQTLHGELIDQRVPSMRGPVSAIDVARFYARAHPVDDSIAVIGMMALAAQRNGQRVLLHGASGDLCFYAPNDTLLRTLAQRGWRAAAEEARAAQRHHTYLQGTPAWRQWVRAAYADGVPPLAKAAWRRLRRWQRGAAFNAVREAGALGERLNLPARMHAASLREDRAAWAYPRLMREHLQALFPIGVLRGLEGYERVAGRYGVELRDPLADRRVIAFCLALPLHWRTRDGWTKYLARRWASAVLPEVCVWRSDKTHLGHLLGAPAGAADVGQAARRASDAALAEAAHEVSQVLAQAAAQQGGQAAELALLVQEYGCGVLAWLDRLASGAPASDAPVDKRAEFAGAP